MQNQLRSSLYIAFALLIGILCGWSKIAFFSSAAKVVSELFLGALQLIAIPIIFLSILSTITGFKSFAEMKFLGRKVLKYTLFTTIIAASIALLFYCVINPTFTSHVHTTIEHQQQAPFLRTLLQMFPTNLVEVFMNNNVFGAALIAAVLGFATLGLPSTQRTHLHTFFSSLFQALLRITTFIIRFIPVGIWAFTTIFLQQILDDYHTMIPLTYYIICVMGANLVQGLITLPLLMKFKGISPSKTFTRAYPALLTAFFSKSSSAALPLAIECTTKDGKVSKRVANFSLPLCSVINMNGCAAFILITVIFVATQAGMAFTFPMMLLWILISTLAAVGNASVPMGCYFLSSAFLVGMGVPIQMMGLILPIYTFIDMLETALNVWSDISITNIVNKEALAVPSFREQEKEDEATLAEELQAAE